MKYNEIPSFAATYLSSHCSSCGREKCDCLCHAEAIGVDDSELPDDPDKLYVAECKGVKHVFKTRAERRCFLEEQFKKGGWDSITISEEKRYRK